VPGTGDAVVIAPEMRRLYAMVNRIADTSMVVLIQGETGTGKELIAEALHRESSRASRRFVKLNCASLPETLLESELFGYERGAFTGAIHDRVGKIELSNGGTLFLDEIESISLNMQLKLLRVLEEREIEKLGSNRRIKVNNRIICATNVDLAQLVAEGRMREDFYYRINVVPVHLPPLRERREDIPLLVAELLRNNPLAREKGVNRCTERVLQQLLSHDWPGNIRELSNVMERAVLRARGDTIREVDIPGAEAVARTSPAPPFRLPLREYLRGAERQYLEEVLSHYRGGIARCARHASIDQATLHRKIKAHGLQVDEFRRNGQGERGTGR
jgi:two-component system response regulator AtoC